LDNVFTICGAFCSWVDIPDQYRPKADTGDYENDKPKNYRRYWDFMLKHPSHGLHYVIFVLAKLEDHVCALYPTCRIFMHHHNM
jgi:hypothetical protein